MHMLHAHAHVRVRTRATSPRLGPLRIARGCVAEAQGARPSSPWRWRGGGVAGGVAVVVASLTSAPRVAGGCASW